MLKPKYAHANFGRAKLKPQDTVITNQQSFSNTIKQLGKKIRVTNRTIHRDRSTLYLYHHMPACGNNHASRIRQAIN
jgi:hypothetical protein